MPVAPNQMHLHPETIAKIKKAKRPKRIGESLYKSGWIQGENYVPPSPEELQSAPF